MERLAGEYFWKSNCSFDWEIIWQKRWLKTQKGHFIIRVLGEGVNKALTNASVKSKWDLTCLEYEHVVFSYGQKAFLQEKSWYIISVNVWRQELSDYRPKHAVY